MKTPKKRSISDLTRDPPDELRPLFELVTNPDHPDSSVAMLGAAVLDHALADAIAGQLKGRVDRAALFDDRGPLGTFNDKIILAEAMGVILPITARDLHCIRRVRNAFAHAAAPITFETPEIVLEMEKLRFFGYRAAFVQTPEGDNVPPKQLFGSFIFITCISLTLTPEQWQKLRDGIVQFANNLLNALRDFRGVYINSGGTAREGP